ncbi:MAG: glycosyltransferase [Cytophagales bacterium]|nr:glycosyltransferase [Cytophagales bacterium]
MEEHKKELIVLIVLTYCRPEMLRSCLSRVFMMDLPSSVGFRVFVVDNDPGRTAFRVADSFPVLYVSESRLGVVHARNRGLEEALRCGATHIAFLDDDSMASPEWLRTLYQRLTSFQADVVSSPSDYRFVSENGFISRHFADFMYLGRSRPLTPFWGSYAHTGSVLFRSSCLVKGFRFEQIEDMDLGEDTFFFRRIHAMGGRILWIPERMIHELYPAARARLIWLFQRNFWVGYTDSLIWQKIKGLGLGSVHAGGRGFMKWVQIWMFFFYDLWRGKSLAWIGIRGFCLFFRGCGHLIGILAGLLGFGK